MNGFMFKKKKEKVQKALGGWLFFWLAVAIVLSAVCFAVQLA